jgi:hypothetical protein
MRLFESQIAQTASRNINRQPPAPSPPLFLPVQAAHVAAVAERLVPPPPPLSLADHEDDDDHHLQLQGASKSGGASGAKAVIERLQGAGGSDVQQQDTRIISSSIISKSADDHLPSSISQISPQAEAEAEAGAVVPAPLEKVINIGPAGGKKAVALPLSPVCELSEMMRLSSSNSQQQQQQSCALPSPGASHDHKRKISEPIEDEVGTKDHTVK